MPKYLTVIDLIWVSGPTSSLLRSQSWALEAGRWATHSYEVNNLFIIALYYVTILSASPAWKFVNFYKKIYLNFLLITQIILLKWLPLAIMLKSVSKVNWSVDVFWFVCTVCIWVSWHHSMWHHDNYVKDQGQKIRAKICNYYCPDFALIGYHSKIMAAWNRGIIMAHMHCHLPGKI